MCGEVGLGVGNCGREGVGVRVVDAWIGDGDGQMREGGRVGLWLFAAAMALRYDECGMVFGANKRTWFLQEIAIDAFRNVESLFIEVCLHA